MRQMQGGKREEACLERRRLDNAVESGVEGSGRYIAIHTIPLQQQRWVMQGLLRLGGWLLRLGGVTSHYQVLIPLTAMDHGAKSHS